MQAPYVSGMPGRARDRRVVAQVLGVDGLGLLDPILLEQQRAVGVARGLHPAPRLVIRQRVVERDRSAEVLERRGVTAAPVLELAVEHRARYGEDVLTCVVEQVA